LKSSIKGGFNNVNKLAEGLEKLTPALEKLKGASDNLQVINNIAQSLSQLKDIKSPTGLKNAVDSLEKLPDIMGKMDTKTFENLARVSNELAQSLTPVAEKMQQISAGYSAFSKVQNTFGKSASTATKYAKQQKSILSGLRPIVSKLGSGFVSLSKGISAAFGRNAFGYMKKFHSKAKQIFLSLLGTRTLFTMIRKAVAEYEAFDQELQDFSQNVWRAFGAQLAPVIYYVMDLFKQFVRVIYSVVLALTGIDLIAKANEKAMAGWGKASKDTLGNLQKFDDLNVVEFPKDKSGDDNKLIELDKIDLSPIQKVIDWVRKLKAEIIEAWNSGEWYGVGEVLAEGINMGTATIINNIGTIRDKFFEIGRDFADLLNGIIQNTNWDDLGKVATEGLKLLPDFFTETLTRIDWDALGKGINDFFKDFDAVEVANSFGRALVAGLKGIGTILAQQDWTAFGKTIGTILANALKGLADLLSTIPWDKVGTTLRNVIKEMPWGDIWDGIVSLAKASFEGLEKFIAGLFDLNSAELITIKTAIVGIGVALVTYKIVDGISKLGSSLSKLSDAKKGLSEIPGLLGNISTFLVGSKENPMLTGAILDMASPRDLTKSMGLFGKVKGSVLDLGDAFVSLGKKAPGAIKSLPGVISKGFGTMKSSVLGLKDSFLALSKTSPTTLLASLKGSLSSIGSFLGSNSTLALGATFAAVTVAVMALVQGFRELWQESEPFRNVVNELITSIKDTLLGILETLIDAIMRIKDSLVNAYNEILKPLWDILVDVAKVILEPLMEILNILWKTIIEPIANFLQTVFTIAIETVCGAFDVLVDILGPVIDVLSWLWQHVLKPIVNFLLDVVVGAVQLVGDIICAVINTLTTIIKGISVVVKTVWNVIWGVIKGIATIVYTVVIKPIADAFVGLKNSVVKAWEQIRDGIGNAWNSIKKSMKDTLNWLIGRFESFLNNMVKGINNLSNGFRKIGNKVFDIIGVDIKFDPISNVSLPRLETGTNEIPYEGIYHLHPGEAVVPKKYNPALGNGGSEEMNAKMDTLIELMSNMNFTNVVNIGNKKVYEGQQAYNKMQQNKYGTTNLY
jgi:phage-related protein